MNRVRIVTVARKHPPHLPSRPCRPPLRCCHNHHHLNTSMTGATSPTLSPYNRRHPTLSHRQGVQKVRLAPPFPRHPHLLTLPVCVGFCTRVAAHNVPALFSTLPRPARRPRRHAGGRRRDSAPTPVPSGLATPSPPRGLRAPPHPHIFPLCAHAGGAGGTGGDARKGRGNDQGGCAEGEGTHARGGGVNRGMGARGRAT